MAALKIIGSVFRILVIVIGISFFMLQYSQLLILPSKMAREDIP